MPKSRVMIAVPCHRHMHGAMEESLATVMQTTKRATVELVILRNESLISRARNTLLAKFLATKNDWLYFWDDDISTLNTGGGRGNLLDMLLSHGEPFIGGLYPTRGVISACASRVGAIDNPDRLMPVVYLAGGSMLVHKAAAHEIAATCPQYKPLPGEDVHGGRVWAAFQPFVHEWEYLSEDFAFCQRYRDIGGQIYADLDVKLLHWGEASYALDDPRENPSA